ncbi:MULTISPECIES: GNAT family N-acetyltransferase [Francisella]|uniref:GNAT family N-acetyltransferase n=2 Tax=Francisella TaxID=262 RepID=A0AAJ4NN60_9GAMM|nr:MULTISPECIES: GNAT family N-acetyltransferase [Francisella]QEO57340.1 GNAT family N-acetyltransferase [Francisella marina]QEO58544.1 GNAT family N-acetyltransferase [Francisella marina]QWU98837.1 GNAT family N-acetyltransferase [Francisella salimarina]
MKIRKATSKDFKDMLYIWKECISTTCQFLTTSEINKEVEILEEKYLNTPETKCFVQVVDDENVGFACIRDKELLFSPVLPSFFGKGLGEAMVKYLFENHDIDTAYVYCSDMHSLAFYTALGFIIDDRIDDIFFDNRYKLNRLKLSISPKEGAERIAAKKKSS